MNLEKDLIARFINADETAFKQLFDTYFRTVKKFVHNHIQDTAQADDITQNIFIRLWENKTHIDINKSFDGYIFTIAYRMIVDHHRQARTALSSRTRDDINDALPSSSFSDELLNLHQLESVYIKALQTLPGKRKEIFLLSRQDGLSNKEIAQRLNISVKTVENQMTSSLARLRSFFTKSDFDTLVFICFYFGLA